MTLLVGAGPNQIPTNSHLGSAAYRRQEDFQPADATTAKTGVAQAFTAKQTFALIGDASQIANGSSGAAKTIAWASGNRQALTLSSNCALAFDWTGCPVGKYQVILAQDATGNRTVTWGAGTPGSTRWLGVSGAPVINLAVSGETFITLYYDGTNSYGSCARVNAL